jgi:hypothetical protein
VLSASSMGVVRCQRHADLLASKHSVYFVLCVCVCVGNAATWLWITFLISCGSAVVILQRYPSDQQAIQILCVSVYRMS